MGNLTLALVKMSKRQGIKRETNFAHIAHTTCQVTSECNDFNHHF